MFRAVLTLLFITIYSTAVQAQAPGEFLLRYSASFGGLKAESTRRLDLSEDGIYSMVSRTELRVLGAEISSIDEYSTFRWKGNLPEPLSYRYEQSGIGSRKRSVDFDNENSTATYQVDDHCGTLAMDRPLYDDLSSFLVLREQLANGTEDISFDVVDKDTIKQYHYHVVDRERLQTEIGIFNAVHVERIRDEGSARSTDFWLADSHDYILLKLVQIEPGEREIRLDITEAWINGEVLIP